jgi:hypothetical protein
MLREIRNVKQDKPGLTRRWFQSDYFDLFTWQEASGAFTGFQLCYDVEHDERAFAWNAQHGFFHDGVDHVESPQSQAAAILVPDGRLDSGSVVPRFTREAQEMAADVRELVLAKIREHLVEARQRKTSRRTVRREDWQKRAP